MNRDYSAERTQRAKAQYQSAAVLICVLTAGKTLSDVSSRLRQPGASNPEPLGLCPFYPPPEITTPRRNTK